MLLSLLTEDTLYCMHVLVAVCRDMRSMFPPGFGTRQTRSFTAAQLWQSPSARTARRLAFFLGWYLCSHQSWLNNNLRDVYAMFILGNTSSRINHILVFQTFSNIVHQELFIKKRAYFPVLKKVSCTVGSVKSSMDHKTCFLHSKF